MIIDRIENAHLYQGISPEVSACLEYLALKQYPLEVTPRFQVTERSSFNVSRYVTKPLEERAWEAHDHCIDLQFVIRGRETISYANRQQMEYCGKTEGKDHLCYEGEGAVLPLEEGYFCILFPEDVHRTKTMAEEPCEVVKGVFKIKL